MIVFRSQNGGFRHVNRGPPFFILVMRIIRNSFNTFYEWQHNRVNLTPAFAAELDADPALNHEHDAFAWLAVDEAAARLRWPEQQRLLRLAHQIVRQGVPPELRVPL